MSKYLTRKERKLYNPTLPFFQQFEFYRKSHQAGILTFSGHKDPVVIYNKDSEDAIKCFNHFNNGEYSIANSMDMNPMSTCEPDLLFSAVKGKSAWGLWKKLWAEGIAECTFFKSEIIQVFTDNNIVIPKELMLDFTNQINTKRYERYTTFSK